MKSLLEYRNYLESDLSTPGKTLVNIFVGRFQPFHLGHLRILETLNQENNKKTTIFYIKGKDTSRHFFSEELTLRMLSRIKSTYPHLLEDVLQAPSANLEVLLNTGRPNYEPLLWGAGEDRVDKYQMQIDALRKRGVYSIRPEFKTLRLERSGDFIGGVSASKIRGAILNNEEHQFQNMLPECLWGFWNEFRQVLGDKK